jgi:hypothetical protein
MIKRYGARHISICAPHRTRFMVIKAILVPVLLFIVSQTALSSEVLAFDGVRKGFVIGGGIGYTPYLRLTWPWGDYNADGLAMSLVVGWAPDNHNFLSYIEDATGFESMSHDNQANGFQGVGWHHYFGNTFPCLQTTVGIGRAVINEGRLSGLIGIGSEFRRHFLVHATFTAGVARGNVTLWRFNMVFGVLGY